jgi:hypothetical protein
MKYRLILVAIFLCFPLLICIAQGQRDIIYMKNGNIFKGTIIENVPSKYIRIEHEGGSIITLKYSEILKLGKEKVSSEEPAKPLVAPTQKEVTEPKPKVEMQQMTYFQKERKSPGTAALFSVLLTSSGHAYAGNWGRGLLFSAGRVGGVILAVAAGSSTFFTRDPYYYASYGYWTTETTSWLYIGIGVAVGFAVWEAIDAAGQVNKYNENLDNANLGKSPMSLNIISGKNGTQLQFAYNF